jgi:acetyltransferase-like isoleucine patch superfamily enzyme
MIRGRNIFRIAYPVLFAVSVVVRFLPLGMRLMLASGVRNVPWKLGIAIRYAVFKAIMPSLGKNVRIDQSVFLMHPQNMCIGDNVSIHPFCYVDAFGGLRISNDVSIAHAVSILTFEHDYGVVGVKIRDAPLAAAPVEIGSDVWIGAGARILSGCTLASRTVVGAGAVVTKSFGGSQIICGVPARKVKDI